MNNIAYEVNPIENKMINKVVIKNASDSKIVRYSYRNMAGDKTLGGNVKNSIGIPMIPFQTYID